MWKGPCEKVAKVQLCFVCEACSVFRECVATKPTFHSSLLKVYSHAESFCSETCFSGAILAKPVVQIVGCSILKQKKFLSVLF